MPSLRNTREVEEREGQRQGERGREGERDRQGERERKRGRDGVLTHTVSRVGQKGYKPLDSIKYYTVMTFAWKHKYIK